MPKRMILFLAALLALMTVPGTASAHFIWAIVENRQVRFALQENVAEPPSAKFEKYVANLTVQSGGKPLTLGSAKEGARYATLPDGQETAVGEAVVGIKEREGETYLLVYHARGAASLAAAGGSSGSYAELTARADRNDMTVTLRQETWPVPDAEIWVQWPGEETPRSYRTDLKGEARLPMGSDAATRGGYIGLRALVKETRAGETEGKRYTAVHHWATLTFPVAPAAGETAAEQPLRRVLRASFGNRHEEAGRMAFNQAVFSGKLTRPQLIVHLQQRALIHNEIHRILAEVGAGESLPYGEAQKQVLRLLFDDLLRLGPGWPTEAQARPLTRAFLDEIRASEKNGPYFALGVFHVYYGGTTNGGRMIGARIGETVGFLPTYYEKSDGYSQYLDGVDRIHDPKARAEMIRGGQAAYRYILAFGNEPL
ncbi:MAG: hypothetical protein SFU56_04745 [Capsulimonadales bacterium]|nr:hypothetical protein [Capsulimonadales bacterium]